MGRGVGGVSVNPAPDCFPGILALSSFIEAGFPRGSNNKIIKPRMLQGGSVCKWLFSFTLCVFEVDGLVN